MSTPLMRPIGLAERFQALTAANYGTFRGFVRSALAHAEFVAGRLEPHLRPPAQTKRLVFVCLGNINRSAFAEAAARGLGANTCSIGLSTSTGAPAFRTAVEIAPEFGLDLREHKATDILDYVFEPGDLLLVMEIRHAHRLVARGIPAESIALLGHWASPRRIHLHDPHTLSDAYFRTCFTLIRSAVEGVVAHMRTLQSPCVAR
jgi:protein-tyrosine phosphatase